MIASADLLVGDVADAGLVAQAMADVDGCFHLAAVASVQRCSEDWLGTHRTNLTGTLTVFDEARRRNPGSPIRVVFASSAAVYGDNPEIPLAETARTRPLSAYGADKLGCELHAASAWIVHRIPTVGLRFFNVYGPRQDPHSPYSGVISIFAERIARDRPVEIFGDGLQARDFVYVEDVVAHLVASMDRLSQGGRVFNVCTGRSTSILDLVSAMAEISGRKPGVIHRPARSGDIRASVGDPTAAAREFGFTAARRLIDGLQRTFAHRADDYAATAARSIQL